MPCRNAGHNHDWSTSGELMIWQCELQCGFCPANKFRRASDLRSHVKKHHQNQFPGLEVLPGKFGHAGKYPTEWSKPRKPKQEKRKKQAKASVIAGNSSPQSYPQQLPLPDTTAHLAELANGNIGLSAASHPALMHSSAIEHTSPAPTQISGYYSAPMSRDTSVAGISTGSFATSYSYYQHAPAQESLEQYSFPNGSSCSYAEGSSLSGRGLAEGSLALPMRSYGSVPMLHEHEPDELNPGYTTIYNDFAVYPGTQVALPHNIHARTATCPAPCDQFQAMHQAEYSSVHPHIVSMENIANYGPYDDIDPHLMALGQSNLIQSQNVPDDSPATTEALKEIETKVDELLDLFATAQNNGADLDSLQAHVMQRIQNVGRDTGIAANMNGTD